MLDWLRKRRWVSEPLRQGGGPRRALRRSEAVKGVRLAATTGRWGQRWQQGRWWLVRALAPRRIVRSRGLTFTLQCNNWITHYRWATYNTKEPETLDWIDQCLRPGDTFFDIGANIGVYTVYAALRHRGLRVVAFEPEYGNLHLLKENVVENRLQDAVEVYGVALGERAGLGHLHLQDLAAGSGLHVQAWDPPRSTRHGRPIVWREGVYVTTLDAFCAEMGLRPHAIKIDVDGTEPAVLEGAPQTLRSPELRSVIIEVAEEAAIGEACERRLAEAGLRRAWRGSSGATDHPEIWARPPIAMPAASRIVP